MDHSHHGGHDAHANHGAHAGHDEHSGHEASASLGPLDAINAVTQAVVDLVARNAHDGGHTDGHSGHGVGHMMSMTFHGGCNETVLFDWWKFTSVGGLFASIFIIFVMAVLYEGLKYYREYLFWSTYNKLQYRAVQPPEEKATPDDSRVVQPSMCSKIHAWQTCLHALQVSVSYLLMLVFMTYNFWLCLAVVAGAATGNFLFGWKKSVIVDVTEHCH